MEHSILKDLPALHATFIGLGGSLFGVYALLSTERNYEAEEQRELDLQELIKLTQYIDRINISDKYFQEGGEPDWKAIWGVRHKLLRDNGSLDNIKNLFDFFSALSNLLLKYRFGDLRSNEEFFKLLPGDGPHCSGIMYVLDTMSVFINNNKGSLFALARQCDECRVNYSKVEADAAMESLQRGEVPRRAENYEGRYGMLNVEYSNTLNGFVDLINAYRALVPKLQTSLVKCDVWNKRLPLKRYAMVALFSVAALMLLGIMLPLILFYISEQNLGVCEKYGLCWNIWYEYSVLGITFLPYFIFIGFVVNKVRKMKGRI